MSRRTRTKEVLDELISGIAELASSDRWQAWLAVQSRFHRYSFTNTLLIHLQRPDATKVAGFHAWRLLDRSVRKGEKAIWILAPVTRKATTEDTDNDDTAAQRVVVGFKAVAVFDIAQTDGCELPTIVAHLQGDDACNAYGQLVGVAQTLAYTVEDAEFTDARNGDCTFALQRIRVASDRSAAQRIKTLAHEIAHAILHEGAPDRAIAELEAESIAYIVCHQIDIASGEYSFGYVTAWAGGGEDAIAAIKTSGNRIQRTADEILTLFNDVTLAPSRSVTSGR